MSDIDDALMVSREDDDFNRPGEELHIGSLLHEHFVNAVAQAELAYFLVCHVLLGLPVYEAETLSIAALHVERHGALRYHVLAKELLQEIWNVVIISIVDILV